MFHIVFHDKKLSTAGRVKCNGHNELKSKIFPLLNWSTNQELLEKHNASRDMLFVEKKINKIKK